MNRAIIINKNNTTRAAVLAAFAALAAVLCAPGCGGGLSGGGDADSCLCIPSLTVCEANYRMTCAADCRSYKRYDCANDGEGYKCWGGVCLSPDELEETPEITEETDGENGEPESAGEEESAEYPSDGDDDALIDEEPETEDSAEEIDGDEDGEVYDEGADGDETDAERERDELGPEVDYEVKLYGAYDVAAKFDLSPIIKYLEPNLKSYKALTEDPCAFYLQIAQTQDPPFYSLMKEESGALTAAGGVYCAIVERNVKDLSLVSGKTTIILPEAAEALKTFSIEGIYQFIAEPSTDIIEDYSEYQYLSAYLWYENVRRDLPLSFIALGALLGRFGGIRGEDFASFYTQSLSVRISMLTQRVFNFVVLPSLYAVTAADSPNALGQLIQKTHGGKSCVPSALESCCMAFAQDITASAQGLLIDQMKYSCAALTSYAEYELGRAVESADSQIGDPHFSAPFDIKTPGGVKCKLADDDGDGYSDYIGSTEGCAMQGIYNHAFGPTEAASGLFKAKRR